MDQSFERSMNIQHVILTARELFIEQGIANTTIHQIAQEAQLSDMSLYRYFQNKQTLIEQVWYDALDFFYKKYQKSFEEEAKNLPTGYERFMKSMELYIRAYAKHPGWLSYTREMFHYANSAMKTNRGQNSNFYENLYRNIPKTVLATLEDGVKDGSIRPDINIFGVYQMVNNLYTGTNIYKYLTEGMSDVDMFTYTAEIIGSYVKNS